jgi:hypothetical protein
MGVHDSPSRVGGFATELEPAARLKVEVRASRGELAHSRGTFLHQDFNRFSVAERRTGGKSVPSVQLGGIAGSQGRRDTSLRIGCSAVEKRPLG